MVNIYIGCAGWDYKDWIGPFYPKKLEKFRQLEYYAKFFNISEINSSFYNLPSEDTVIKWLKRTPEDFRFIIKVWQEITHKLGEVDLDERISQFFYRMRPLEDKIYGYLFQFPPWFKYSEEHLQKLNQLFSEIPSDDRFKHIYELRDDSWFNPKILSKFIDGNGNILGTTYKPGMQAYYFPNQKIYYIRLIGDRELTIFNRIQRKQEQVWKDLINEIKIFQKSPNIYEIFIIVNNHFQGFAPESAILLKKELNIPSKAFNQQKRLSDYF